LNIGFIDSKLELFKFTGTGLVGIRFVRPAEPKRFIFANRIPSVLSSERMHQLEDGMETERIAWTQVS
jgi:hypothetical protein